MTQNEVSIIKNSVLDATEAYVDAILNNANFVKTQIGEVIHSAKSSETDPTKPMYGKYLHKVRCNATRANPNGIVYSNVLSVGNVQFPNTSIVFLVAPNAQFSNQFILGKLDSSPANIVGGEIHIGEIPSSVAHPNNVKYYFNVNSTGEISAFKGSLKLGSYVNGGYNVELDDNGLRLGRLNSSGNYNFNVTNAGQVTIKSGSILLNEYGSTGHYNVDINSTGLGLGWNGSSHNFTVSNSGVVNISRGSINIGGGQFYVDTSGNLTAKYLTANIGGNIAGWTISPSGLHYGSQAWVEPELIACGSHGGTHIKMRGHNNADSSGYLSVEVNDAVECVRVFTGNIRKYDQYGNSVPVEWGTSDVRLKKNIKKLSLENSLDFINKLIPKEYEMKTEEGKRYGFIAQDVDKITGEDFNIAYKDEEYIFLHYNDIIAPLVKVVQEQQKEIDELKSKLGV